MKSVHRPRATVLAAVLAFFAVDPAFGEDPFDGGAVERGRYLVRIAGCNDCHTPGYAATGGETPESEWLLGDTVGWRGPWGTTYAPNLRLSLLRMTGDDWLIFARNLRSRPPMPSFNLNRMSEEDLRAIYAFVRQLEPLGSAAPDYVPPGVEPHTAYVLFPTPPEP